MTPDGGWDPRLSVNAFSSRHWTLAEDLACYERLGIGRVSVLLPKLVAAGADRAVAEIGDRGLTVDGILPGCSFDLTDDAGWNRVRETMVEAVETGARLGARTLQTTGGTGRGRPFEWAVERFARAVEPVTRAARGSGVSVALEPTRPQFAHVGLAHSLRDGLRVSTQLDLGLVVDTAHLWWEHDFGSLLAEAGGRLAVVQVADLHFAGPVLERLVPGDGELPLADLLAACAATGFEGPYEVEILGRAVEDEGYELAIDRSLAHLQRLLEASDRPG